MFKFLINLFRRKRPEESLDKFSSNLCMAFTNNSVKKISVKKDNVPTQRQINKVIFKLLSLITKDIKCKIKLNKEPDVVRQYEGILIGYSELPYSLFCESENYFKEFGNPVSSFFMNLSIRCSVNGPYFHFYKEDFKRWADNHQKILAERSLVDVIPESNQIHIYR